MSRVGFIFKIKPELKEEYKKAHDDIWPEWVKAMRDVGLRNYSIFFKRDGTLFAYLEATDYKNSMKKLKGMDIRTRWEKHMEKYFIKKDKAILGPEIEMLEEVSHID